MVCVVAMKRSREAAGDFDNITSMANCLMLLSRGTAETFEAMSAVDAPSRVFECKTCNRQFPSFQALGGHRASHKKPRMGDPGQQQQPPQTTSPAKPKTHECSICGLEFAIGQALGGHMRRHRATMTDNLSLSPPRVQGPVVKKSPNSRRILSLDLNLTPLENDLEFKLGKVAPMVVDCFL